MTRAMRCASLLLALALPVVAHAERWNDMLAESSTALKKGDYKHSVKITNRAINEMVDMLGPGSAETELFAVAVSHKALAYAGLQQFDEAQWYWWVAIGILPTIANADLSPFGAAGEFLKPRVPQPPPPTTPGVGDKEIVAPKLRKRVNPEYPRAAQYFDVSGLLVVEVVIDTTGHVTSPRVKKALPAPTLTYCALEALKQWQFDPGRLNGDPVPVIFVLSLNFKL